MQCVWFCPQPSITVHKAAALFTKGVVTFPWLPAGTPGVSTCTLRGAHEPASRTPCDAAQLGNKGDTGTAGTNLVRIPCSQARSMEGRRTHLGYSEYGIPAAPAPAHDVAAAAVRPTRNGAVSPSHYRVTCRRLSPSATAWWSREGERVTSEPAFHDPSPLPPPPPPPHGHTTSPQPGRRGPTWQFFCS